jgi:secreted trypsin-like serine protease
MVNGVDTKKGEYLFHTQVGGCSGALIAPDVILATGHEMPPIDVAVGMTVTVGAYYTDPTKNAGGDQHTITQAFVHPDYATIHNDFSILILDKPSDIKPIRINRDSQVPVAHTNVTLLGTGTFNLTTSERSVVLQESTVTYLPNDECRTSYDPARGVSYAGDFLDETNLCTTGTSDGCAFDSGGPVIVEKDGRDLLIALISFGVDCADPFYPAVNARVSGVYEWIDELVCQHSSDPPKDFHCGTRSKNQTATSKLLPSSPSKPPAVAPGKSTKPLFSLYKVLILLGAGTAASVFFAWKSKAKSTEGERQRLLSQNNGDGGSGGTSTVYKRRDNYLYLRASYDRAEFE